MGNRPSVETIQLPQDPYYIKHCRLQPQREFFLSLLCLFGPSHSSGRAFCMKSCSCL